MPQFPLLILDTCTARSFLTSSASLLGAQLWRGRHCVSQSATSRGEAPSPGLTSWSSSTASPTSWGSTVSGRQRRSWTEYFQDWMHRKRASFPGPSSYLTSAQKRYGNHCERFFSSVCLLRQSSGQIPTSKEGFCRLLCGKMNFCLQIKRLAMNVYATMGYATADIQFRLYL